MDEKNNDIDFIKLHFDVDREALSVWVLKLTDLIPRKSLPKFEEYEKAIFGEIRAQMNLESMKDDVILRSYRNLYWTFGMDPTKLRVSSEALVRRILRGLNLWRISDIVDVANLASAYHRLPIGLIDYQSITGDLHIRTARKGEVFHRIGGDTLICRGREIVLSDDEKILCFGFATHDSDLSKVQKSTREVLLLIYGAPAASAKIMNNAKSLTLEMVEQWVQCTIAGHKTFRSS